MPESSCLPESSPGNITGLCCGEPGENSEFLRESNSSLGIFLCVFLHNSAGRSQELCPGVFRPSDGSVSCKTLVMVFLYRGRVV